jgi:hypothetical protein
MFVQDNDPLIARVHAADPLARRTLRTDLDRPRVHAAGRRHARRRLRRFAASGGALAVAATAAVALAPTSSPDGASILVRAVQASEPPPNSILAVVSEQTVDSRTLRVYTWVRTSARGRLLDTRVLRENASHGFDVAKAEDRVGYTNADGVKILRVYWPRTKQTLTTRNHADDIVQLGVFLHDAHAVLARARKLGERVDVGARVARAGRDVYPVRMGPAIGPDNVHIQGGEMLIDAKTYKPLAFKLSIEGTTASERVLSERVLPDTPQNRRFLKLRGPIR